MELPELIQTRTEELIEAMFELRDTSLGTPDEEVRQFYRGYVGLMAAAASGDLGPRDAYLETVIPAIKSGGMPLTAVMDGMIRVAMVSGALLGADHLPWMVDFNAQYTRRLLEIWASD